MNGIQIESVSAPLDVHSVILPARRLLSTADAMGLLEGLVIRRIDLPTLSRVAARLAEVGIGGDLRAALATAPAPEVLAPLLSATAEALEQSPVPEREWTALGQRLDDALLAELLGISATSLRRYRAGQRATPDDVAERLHFIATVVGDLMGAYNDFGIRRWFRRERQQLDRRSPAKMLRGEWRPDDPAAARVRALARALRDGASS